MSELSTRLVLGSAMLLGVGGIFLLDLYWTAGFLSAVFLGLLALAGCHEYVAMFRQADFAVSRTLLLLLTLLLCGSAPWFEWRSVDHELYPLVGGTFLLLFLLGLRALSSERAATGLEAMGSTMLGFILVAWPLYLAQGLALHHLPSLLFVILVCKGGDIGAYLLGRALGRRKLLPHVSPGKTVEGAVGSMVASCLIAVVLRQLLLMPEVDVTLTGAVLVGIMLNITAQIGDLVESLLKRRCRVKDSSALLPAHGGVLDLLDSLLFSFPAYFLVLTLVLS
ncbi:MAG: phosphatidate cytidylyltransferase [Planctomycetota bacterium]